MNQYRLYTDGSSHARGEKPGGWAWILTVWCGDGVREPRQLAVINAGHGGHLSTTNNVMELTAIMRGLRAIRDRRTRRGPQRGDRIEVVSDSQYAIGMASGRFRPSKNQNLVAELTHLVDALRCDDFTVDFSWMRGHAGEAWNERVDGLAKLGKSMAEKKLAALKHQSWIPFDPDDETPF